MPRLLLLVLLAALLMAGPACALDFYTVLEADSYAAPVPVKAFVSNWQAGERGGDTAFLDAHLESGVHMGNSSLAYVWRDDYLLHFTPNTATIYHQYKNGQPPPQGENPLLISIHQAETEGIKLGRQLELPAGWRLDAGFNLLQGMLLTEGTLQGNADIAGPELKAGDIDSLDATINYHYSRPALREGNLGWYPPRPHGLGGSLDLALAGQLAPRLRASLRLNNVLGYMVWHDVPATRYNLACQCAQGTHNITGQLQIDAAYRQALPWTAQAALDYDLGQHVYTELSAFANRLSQFAALGAGYHWPRADLLAGWEPQTHSLFINASGRHAGLRLQEDTLDPARAHRLGLSLYAGERW